MTDSMRDRIERELGKDRLHELDKPVFGGRQLSDKQIEEIADALLEAFPWLADEPRKGPPGASSGSDAAQARRRRPTTDWTPDTNHVRAVYLHGFDRWLDQVKADAWDEGEAAGWTFCAEAVSEGNPYRKEAR